MDADLPQAVLIERALAVARVRAVRDALVALHKALLDAERRRYERVHGRIDGAHAALKLALEDPFFRWLTPLSALIVQTDERLSDDGAPLDAAGAEIYARRVRQLVHGPAAEATFLTEYHRALQDTPDVVVAHGRVMALVGGRAPADS